LGKEATGVLRNFGVDLVGAVPWGTHLCQLYETKQDSLDIIFPYFAAGLHDNEYCLWVTSSPQEATEATASLKQAIPRFSCYLKQNKMAIINYTDIFTGSFDVNVLLDWLLEQEKTAVAYGSQGYGLLLPRSTLPRISGTA
jgi:hypothetical protein